MNKLCLLACLLMPLVANAQPAPKVVFIGDYITAQWASAFAANPNWINQGNPTALYLGSYEDVLTNFQTNVVSLHPAAVHVLIGLSNAVTTDDASTPYTVPGVLGELQGIVQAAKAANIKVILGIEPYIPGLDAQYLQQIDSVIATYGAANNIPVINYADAFCGCVSAVSLSGIDPYTNPAGETFDVFAIPGDVFGQYGGGPYFEPSPPGIFNGILTPFPGSGDWIITPTGYNLMTQMAEATINTMNLKLVTGWLSNTVQPNINLGIYNPPPINVNTVPEPAVVKFTPIGYYSDGSQHPLINTTFQGSSGTWTSSNPLVMYINQAGLAWAVSQGTAIIRYTSPTGVSFSEWIMYVD